MSCRAIVSPISGGGSRVDDQGERKFADEAIGEDGRVRRDWTELKENFESEGGEKTRRGAHGGEK